MTAEKANQESSRHTLKLQRSKDESKALGLVDEFSEKPTSVQQFKKKVDEVLAPRREKPEPSPQRSNGHGVVVK